MGYIVSRPAIANRTNLSATCERAANVDRVSGETIAMRRSLAAWLMARILQVNVSILHVIDL